MNKIPEKQYYKLDADSLRSTLQNTALSSWCEAFIQAVARRELHHGDLPRWQESFDALPTLNIERVDLDHPLGVCAMTAEDIAAENALEQNKQPMHSDDGSPTYVINERAQTLASALEGLKPWRKGPYQIGHVTINTEWHSDWKWNRVLPHISDLTNRTVLDVGCGNGYHMWRMRSAGASCVLGIDPSILFSVQFQAIQKYINDTNIALLPLTMEALPANMQVFDTVFSMGVLYHRQQPLEHLKELLAAVKPGGELVLETLVTLGEEASTLKIEGRYARMRNIWELPTVPMLANWMKDSGFTNIRFVSIDTTSRLEQRTTEWMQFESLTESLDPENRSLTVEGLPRPRRAIMIADAPDAT